VANVGCVANVAVTVAFGITWRLRVIGWVWGVDCWKRQYPALATGPHLTLWTQELAAILLISELSCLLTSAYWFLLVSFVCDIC
jgi:hypothetical protein